MTHQESCPTTVGAVSVNKSVSLFDRNLYFVSNNTETVNSPVAPMFDINNPDTYLKVADAIAKSGLHNYQGLRIPLTSGFNS